MTELFQTLIFGLLLGGVYALMATGLTLTFGVMGIVNIAQGAMLITSAYLCYALWSALGIDPMAAALLVAPVMGALGLVMYKLLIERVHRIDRSLTLVVTFAIAMVAEGAVALIWGPNPTLATPGYLNAAIHVGGLTVPDAQLFGLLLGVGVTVVLQLILRRTWLGHAITAATENAEGARLVGVEPSRVGMWVFAIATGSTAFGGAALCFLYQFTPDTQDAWIGIALSVVILGGLGSVPGALGAGLVLGLAESLCTTYVSVRWAAAVPAAFIIVALFVRPQGLFASASRRDLVT